MSGYKDCSFCHKQNNAAARNCKYCNHPFGIRKIVVETQPMIERESELIKATQTIVQECLPPNYTYLGSHPFQNVKLSGPPIVIHMAVSPTGTQFQRNTAGELVSIAWNHCLRKTSLNKK